MHLQEVASSTVDPRKILWDTHRRLTFSLPVIGSIERYFTDRAGVMSHLPRIATWPALCVQHAYMSYHVSGMSMYSLHALLNPLSSCKRLQPITHPRYVPLHSSPMPSPSQPSRQMSPPRFYRPFDQKRGPDRSCHLTTTPTIASINKGTKFPLGR
jgi:hypothetical protein